MATSAKDMLERLRREQGDIPGLATPKRPKTTRGEAFARGGLEQLLSNALQVPAIIGRVARATPGVRLLAQPLQEAGEAISPGPITAQGLLGGAQAAAELPAALAQGELPSLSSAVEQQQQASAQAAQDQPGFTTAGRVAGDVATLLTGRAPIARVRAPAIKARREAAEAQVKVEIPEAIRDEFSDVISGKVIPLITETGKRLKRGTQRAGEAGIETAALAALSDADPLDSAMLGAGAQAGGSLGLFLSEKPVKRLLPVVATATVIAQMFKAIAPGERNIFESFDFAIDKSIGMLALGAAGMLTGAGRLRGKQAEQFPALLDLITAVPRGIVQSRLRELTVEAEQGNDAPLSVLEKLSTSPQDFPPSVLRRLERSLKSDKPGAFVDQVNKLMRNNSFREKLQPQDVPSFDLGTSGRQARAGPDARRE